MKDLREQIAALATEWEATAAEPRTIAMGAWRLEKCAKEILALLAESKGSAPGEDSTYVAWLRFNNGSISTCDSDAEGAFKVWRHPQQEHGYMPTMDEAYRFIKSNPLTSGDILREVGPAASPETSAPETLITKEWQEWHDGAGHKLPLHECGKEACLFARKLSRALPISSPTAASDLLPARQWLSQGGGGLDGEDGIRAMMISGEGLVEALESYREYLLAASAMQMRSDCVKEIRIAQSDFKGQGEKSVDYALEIVADNIAALPLPQGAETELQLRIAEAIKLEREYCDAAKPMQEDYLRRVVEEAARQSAVIYMRAGKELVTLESVMAALGATPAQAEQSAAMQSAFDRTELAVAFAHEVAEEFCGGSEAAEEAILGKMLSYRLCKQIAERPAELRKRGDK